MADYNSGSDAAYIKPKFIPNEELHGRDDSGGPDFDPYTARFGDGGRVTGAKSHLSAKGGMTEATQGDEESHAPRQRAARRAQEKAN